MILFCESFTMISKNMISSPVLIRSFTVFIHNGGSGLDVNLSEEILVAGLTLPVFSSSVTTRFL